MYNMRCARASFATVLAAARRCSTAGSGAPPAAGTPAPKKQRRRIVPAMDASTLIKNVPSDPGASAELSTAELERKVEQLARMSPKKLEEMVAKYEKDEEDSSRVLVEDSLYQMDVSLKPRSAGAVRVFWKDVGVEPIEKYEGWFAVTVDGRRVKAFESKQVLAVPSEAMALCCAQEWAEQTGYINKLLMPMTDICSGALHVAPQMIPPRIEYLLSFYQNDNMYYRAAPIAAEQDELIEPIAEWFRREFNVPVPRVVGIGYPNITPHAVAAVRDRLLDMGLNTYQVIALCVAAQFTSSLLLPLALFHGVIDLPTALTINKAEEHHNVSEAGMIEGYHDIRDADVVTKICACATAWEIMKDVPLARSLEMPRILSAIDEAESV